ncbi:MAG: pentapeptide repeat-containing protein [Anaerolineae bacterium]
MSEYTREEILKLIEENNGPNGLDLSGKDLSGIDLSREAIAPELEKARKRALDEAPVWYSEEWTRGINLVGVNLQGANLRGANLQGADLMWANLQEVTLMHAILQEASLALAKLQGAILWNTDLQRANLRSSHFETVDFLGVESRLEGAYFYHAFFDDTRMRREQLGREIGEELDGRYYEAKEAYLALKNNFAEIGRYGDESWAYVKEWQMGKMCSAPWRARRFYGESQLGDSKESRLPAWHPRVWWFYARHTWKWFWDWVAEGTCKYGESIFRTLGTMAVALVGFADLYRLLGAVVDASGNPSSGWLHCLLYSGGAFTTFGVDTLRPANDWIRALSIFESAVGIALTGLLGFVLGNRIRRS